MMAGWAGHDYAGMLAMILCAAADRSRLPHAIAVRG